MSAAEASGAMESSLGKAGLKAARIVPLSDGDIQLQFSDVPVSKWAPWLAEHRARTRGSLDRGHRDRLARRRRAMSMWTSPCGSRASERGRCERLLFVLAAVAGLLATVLVIAPAQWAAVDAEARDRRTGRARRSAGHRMERFGASLVLASSPRARRAARDVAGAALLAPESVVAARRPTRPDADASVGAYAAAGRARSAVRRRHGHVERDDGADCRPRCWSASAHRGTRFGPAASCC